MKRKSSDYPYGFTLVELLVVVSIITTLLAVVGFSSIQLVRRAQASRIASEFKMIESAWQIWRVDAAHNYPKQDEFMDHYSASQLTQLAADHCRAETDQEPLMRDTVLFQNEDFNQGTTAFSNPNWRGPYLQQPVVDPFGREYTYDSDFDAYGLYSGAVNIFLMWCASDEQYYRPLVNTLNTSIDGTETNPDRSGKFRWRFAATSGYGYGFFAYNIDDDPNIY